VLGRAGTLVYLGEAFGDFNEVEIAEIMRILFGYGLKEDVND
jgi:hypothetical protein